MNTVGVPGTIPSRVSNPVWVQCPWLWGDALAGKVLAQGVHVRPLAHKREPRARQLRQHVAQVAQPLLDAEAADVDQERRLVRMKE